MTHILIRQRKIEEELTSDAPIAVGEEAEMRRLAIEMAAIDPMSNCDEPKHLYYIEPIPDSRERDIRALELFLR